MTREILFRGKRVDNGEWVYGDMSTHPENSRIWISQWEQNMGDFKETFLSHMSYEVIPETVGQFTGLTDKNGTKIFEGDLLSVFDHYNDAWTTDSAPVIFSHEYVGGWVITNGKDSLTLGKRQDKLTITSNIHDNHTT